MICPNCGSEKNYVIDSRTSRSTDKRRRRVCNDCGEHWSTLEVPLEFGRTRVVTLCVDCYLHGLCIVESTLKNAGAKKPYCSEGKPKKQEAV